MKAHFFLFNREGYGEFFSGITPESGHICLQKLMLCLINTSPLIDVHLISCLNYMLL